MSDTELTSASYDYEGLKALAKELNRPASTLIALAAVNDPFYIGLARQRNAEWFAAIWNRFGLGSGIHVRRIHYRIISQSSPVQMPDGTPFENTKGCAQVLGDASRDARYLGLVPIEAFVDRRNAEPITNLVTGTAAEIGVANDDLSDAWLPEDMPDLPALTLTAPTPEQRYHVELWAEETTMNDVLEPLARQYGVNLITGMGELSLTACHLFLERVEASGRPARILYVSDFDPAGDNMPVAVARKIEFELAPRPRPRHPSAPSRSHRRAVPPIPAAADADQGHGQACARVRGEVRRRRDRAGRARGAASRRAEAGAHKGNSALLRR
jgi:hypothetical protein